MKKLVWFAVHEDQYAFLGEEENLKLFIKNNVEEDGREETFMCKYMTDEEIAELPEDE